MSALAPNETVDTLYHDHHAWLVGWLRKKLGCTHNAADLAHDTFVRVLGRKPEELDRLREPRAWLTTIAHGLVVDHVRRQALERAYLEAVAHWSEPEVPSPETRMLLLESLARIDALLDQLSPKIRTAFLLSRLEGLSYPEIARQMRVSLSSVEKYMATALRHCYTVRYAN